MQFPFPVVTAFINTILFSGSHKENDERVYHAYYQWVPIVLSLQAAMFYAPHWIWKQLEGGRLKNVICGLENKLSDDESKEKKVSQLVTYMKQRFYSSKKTREHEIWAAKFFFCELLNFVNIMAQIFITDSFLGGEFMQYGTEVFNFPYMEPEDRVDPMSRVFPRMTKCIFYKYGGSGTIQRIDSMCVLSMNILNEKIYIYLWVWFILLAVITGVFLIVRALQFFMPDFRERMTMLEAVGYVGRHDIEKQRHIQEVVQKFGYSDWLILYYLARVRIY